MPAPDVVSVFVTAVNHTPGSPTVAVTVSVHRRINRQARKLQRAHKLDVTVTYDADDGTGVTLGPAQVLIAETRFGGILADKRRSAIVDMPIGTNSVPGANPNLAATAALILAPKPGTNRDDDDGDDSAIDEATYDNT